MERGPESDPELTERELEVLRLVCEGLPDKEIAVRVGVSPATVRTHVAHVRRKLGAVNRAELGVRAACLGLLASNREP